MKLVVSNSVNWKKCLLKKINAYARANFFYSLYNLIISSDDNINKKSHGVKKK